MLQFDVTHALPFLPKNWMSSRLDGLTEACNLLERGNGLGGQFTGWVKLPETYDRQEVQRLLQTAQIIRKQSDVLIVISAGKSTRANGYLDIVQDELTQAGVAYAVFDKILANPVLDNVMDGAEFARAEGCDFVVGLGGGSSIDAAKAIAMMVPNEGNYWDYIYGGTGGGQRMKNKPLPIVAIPTTAGTGTELDAWTVVTNEETKEKMSGGNKNTFPVLAIVDPNFMLSVPPKFTAYQGFDALFHSTESYINNTNTLMRDMLALKAIESVGQNLATEAIKAYF